MPSFTDAHLKIKRANEHIRNIKRRIKGLEESYTAVIDVDAQSGYQYIKYDVADKTAAKDISLLIGDALHNLKCALDYVWLAILGRYAPSAITDKTQFPAYSSQDSFESALKKAKIDVLCPPLFNLMTTKIKIYAGGNNAALWTIKKLNILDKHRLLLPLITYTGIQGLQMENDRGEPEKMSGSATMLAPPWSVRIPSGWHVKDKGKPSIAILFDEGTPTHHLDAADFLDMYSVIVLEVVDTLERFPTV